MSKKNEEELNILLVAVNAKYIHSNPAIYSLRGYLPQELRSFVSLAEYTINHYMQDILADLYKRQPDVIAFSCYIWNWRMIQELLEELPKVLPEVEIWLGGPEVSFHSEQLLVDYPMLKGVMIGEGEVTFRELTSYYAAKRGLVKHGPDCLQEIAGLCLPEGYTAYRDLTDMNQLPFLYENLEDFENRIIYYETSRGCPYRCSYCLSSIDKKVRLRDITIVKQELQFFLDHDVKQVKFVDRTFNCDHAHAMDIWHFIKEHDNGVTNFHFEISADILREEEIELLNTLRPGLVQLEIGVQSTNPETIRSIDRVMDVEKLERIVASIHKGNNIHQHLDLIAGLPYEGLESFENSFDRVYRMKPDQLQLGFLKVLKGSPMEERAQEYGVKYLKNPPYEVLCSKWLSYDDILLLKQVEEMVELYYNSDQFGHTLPFLEKAFSGPFQMYLAMARFYEKKGYFLKSPARSYRYQILLDFATAYDGKNREIYAELLLYDMYLRENLKSRPDFACAPTEDKKEWIRDFYKKEEEERKYLQGYVDYDSKQLSKMTHMEYFRHPVWQLDLCEKGDNADGGYVLFDYRERNPLTYEAGTIVLHSGFIYGE